MISWGQDTTLHIEQIKMEQEKIDKAISKFTVVEEDVDDESTEGGSLKKYYDGTVLRKAVLELFGETGKSITQYYFENGDLIFVSDVETTYKAPIYMGKTELDTKEEEKFYFNKSQLKLWLDAKGIPKNPSLYAEKEEEFMSDLKNIINKSK
jgi:hypothetical protein